MIIIIQEEKLIELIADIEHQQWMHWANTLMQKETLSQNRILRWKKLFVPYSELLETDKEYDRKWAKKVIDILKVYKY